MTIPDQINADWVEARSDAELVEAELELGAAYRASRAADEKHKGTSYRFMRGPAVLTHAWMRWSMVRNGMAARGMRLPRQAH